MLFNSFAFLFFYLPVVLAGYFWLGQRQARWAAAWLALASLFFYAYWDSRYLPLLTASICVNYGCGRALVAAAPALRKPWLAGALCANLGLLAYYKYANFFVDTVNSLGAAHWAVPNIVLPVGISFFTFTQIAFLVDCYRGEVREYRFIHYALFVSYFPHLIAGPVLHHKDMMPQFADPANCRPLAANFAVGLSIFVIGLAKKVLIADNIAPMVGPVFAAGAQPQLLEAWLGTLAYTFQLYFDFSAYSDMAIGLSRLFGVKLPLNFNSPYKATDISAFWRRWHMSLSRFLRDYLYIALGGSRAGRLRRYRNLLLTMLLGGLWHGAGWTFVVWGGLHGIYLVIHHAWAYLMAGSALRRARWWPAAAGAITFVAVMLGWVCFRAADLASAVDVLGALAGGNGISLPRGLQAQAHYFAAVGLAPQFDGIRWIDFSTPAIPVLMVAMLLAFFAPNTQEIFFRYEPCIERIVQARGGLAVVWSPSKRWSLACATLFIACVFGMNRVTEFLYFQF
ncbi:MBOAT family O-acyltransferase [Janthinobacterium fluminis]|uniref:Probable alginate O-acetylase AlgI n=1 Tax=Janthinobacterium fluminis TaxID=2987524 RepID=A0ABT5JVX0_9BURK|nr:MBOAT family O-acyltransferase [Janthinobacterium fluminis]MDC8756856.1 MBOAT family protein [Janthinobacterium fluminis]